MRSGIFLPPFHPTHEDATLCIHRDFELMEHLDRIGFDEAWIGEHHSVGWEIIPSPELFIAAAVERTKRLRFGTGVISLPYHNPLMVAHRMIQLDHQSRGRVMFGVGPGLLASDAMQLGIDPTTQRDRMVEALEVIVRLLAGERVTVKTDWFELVDAACQIAPYTRPRPELAVASAATPSGGKVAGRFGLGLLCVAATHLLGYDALAVNWKIANDEAAKHGHVMERSLLRLVGPMHIAETRQEAMENVKFGIHDWQDYLVVASGAANRAQNSVGSIEELIKADAVVIGTPDDAIAQIRRLQAKQGDFGCFLHLAHNWADFDKTKKSYEMFQRYVMPVINDTNRPRVDSFEWSVKSQARLSAATTAAVKAAIAKHEREQAS